MDPVTTSVPISTAIFLVWLLTILGRDKAPQVSRLPSIDVGAVDYIRQTFLTTLLRIQSA